MPEATVTVEAVAYPKEGKAYGSIKTKELGWIGMKPDKLSLFTKGQSYLIEYKVSGDEGQWKNFVRVIPKPNGAGASGHVGPIDNSRMIFITGIVGRAIGSGKFAMQDIFDLTMTAAKAYDTLHAPKPQAAPKRESYGDPRDVPLNDGVEF